MIDPAALDGLAMLAVQVAQSASASEGDLDRDGALCRAPLGAVTVFRVEANAEL